jgi:hypothetical protein
MFLAFPRICPPVRCYACWGEFGCGVLVFQLDEGIVVLDRRRSLTRPWHRPPAPIRGSRRQRLLFPHNHGRDHQLLVVVLAVNAFSSLRTMDAATIFRVGNAKILPRSRVSSDLL